MFENNEKTAKIIDKLLWKLNNFLLIIMYTNYSKFFIKQFNKNYLKILFMQGKYDIMSNIKMKGICVEI